MVVHFCETKRTTKCERRFIRNALQGTRKQFKPANGAFAKQHLWPENIWPRDHLLTSIFFATPCKTAACNRNHKRSQDTAAAIGRKPPCNSPGAITVNGLGLCWYQRRAMREEKNRRAEKI